MRDNACAVYIMASRGHGALYTGVTADLPRRVFEHRTLTGPGSFTRRYQAVKLVHYETHSDMLSAIQREKQIKGWTRAKKVALIQAANASWQDLWPQISS